MASTDSAAQEVPRTASEEPQVYNDLRGPLHQDGELLDVDPNVTAHFPAGSTLVKIINHGGSKWTKTYRVDLLDVDDENVSFFLKTAVRRGEVMLRGEYEGVKAIQQFAPGFAPHPIAWGQYATDPNTYFYLANFEEMVDELPDTDQFCARLAELHVKSQGHCPEGLKFGFPVETLCGTLWQKLDWTPSWEEWFARVMRSHFEEEERVNGPWPEIQEYLEPFFDKVIPRLLRPLQSEGRTLVPVLLHNDIWYGNVARRVGSGIPISFDPATMWGHHEFDLRGWRNPQYRIANEWMTEYLKHVPVSEPKEEFDARHELYSCKGKIAVSALHPGNPQVRPRAVAAFRELVETYKDATILPPLKFDD